MKVKITSKTLSNGQIATVFLMDSVYHGFSYIEVALYVGKSRSDAKRWYNGHINYRSVKSTGKCGLEALLFALTVVKTLRGKNVVIQWADKKRESAYKYLTRIGFQKRYFKGEPEDQFYCIFAKEWR